MRQGFVAASRYLTGLVAGIGILLVTSCASRLPQEIRQAPPGQPTIAEARQAGERLVGSKVRWGGELIEVANRSRGTELEILGRPLDRDGEPDPEGASEGRFLAQYPGFLDPADYQSGQRVTVAGTLRDVRDGLVGEYVYRYPVVGVSTLHRWPQEVPVSAYPPPYWGPCYDPWWPRPFHCWPPFWW